MPDKSVLDFINEVAADAEHIHEVSVLPLMCGTGKSTAISYKIKETIEQAETTGDGLLIITDRTDRMDDYMHPHNQDLQNYLQKYKNKVTIMHHDNLAQAYKTFKFRPVLMMTTQRFFRLTPPEREDFLVWDKGIRPLVLIDERPELTTIAELNESKIHECIIAVERTLKKNLHNSPAVEIELIEKAFQQFTEDMKFSGCNRLDHLYCFWTWYENAESSHPYPDEFLYDLYVEICKNREKINSFKGEKNYVDIYTRIRALWWLRRKMALIHHQKLRTATYMDSFYVFLDNASALNSNAKFIILDGTAELSPEYKVHPYDMRSCAEYSRDLSRLKIQIINVPTNKTSMVYDNSYRERVQDYVERYFDENIKRQIGENKEKYAIFTYKDVEEQYKKLYDTDRVEHFGNIVGKNDFRKATHILQIGINRYPDAVYYLYYLALHPDKLNDYENMNKAYKMIETYPALPSEEQLEYLGTTLEQWLQDHKDEAVQEKDKIDSNAIIKQSNEIEQQLQEHHGEAETIMNHMLLAEIEQNMFRGIIRNSNLEEDYTFHLFINTTNYKSLIELMRARYEPLGAEIQAEMVSLDVQIMKLFNRKNAGLAKDFIKWHDTKLNMGETYTPKRIREELEIKNKAAVKSYEQMVKNKTIKALLAEEKDVSEKERGVYKKARNWYYLQK